MDVIGLQDSLAGPPSLRSRQGKSAAYQITSGKFLVDDTLDVDEVDAICGHYDLGIGTVSPSLKFNHDRLVLRGLIHIF